MPAFSPASPQAALYAAGVSLLTVGFGDIVPTGGLARFVTLLIAASGPAHESHPYRVVGILAPTGTVIDRLVVTSVESVWHVHEEHAPARPEITALLIRYATPLAAAMLPRAINATTAMQATPIKRSRCFAPRSAIPIPTTSSRLARSSATIVSR